MKKNSIQLYIYDNRENEEVDCQTKASSKAKDEHPHLNTTQTHKTKPQMNLWHIFFYLYSCSYFEHWFVFIF